MHSHIETANALAWKGLTNHDQSLTELIIFIGVRVRGGGGRGGRRGGRENGVVHNSH